MNSKIDEAQEKAQKVRQCLEAIKPGLFRDTVKNAVVRGFEELKQKYPYQEVQLICDQAIAAIMNQRS